MPLVYSDLRNFPVVKIAAEEDCALACFENHRCVVANCEEVIPGHREKLLHLADTHDDLFNQLLGNVALTDGLSAMHMQFKLDNPEMPSAEDRHELLKEIAAFVQDNGIRGILNGNDMEGYLYILAGINDTRGINGDQGVLVLTDPKEVRMTWAGKTKDLHQRCRENRRDGRLATGGSIRLYRLTPFINDRNLLAILERWTIMLFHRSPPRDGVTDSAPYPTDRILNRDMPYMSIVIDDGNEMEGLKLTLGWLLCCLRDIARRDIKKV